jgi:hypothetical protein
LLAKIDKVATINNGRMTHAASGTTPLSSVLTSQKSGLGSGPLATNS